MNIPIEGMLSKLWQNKHTSAAALIYGLAKFGTPLAVTWWPAKKAQLEATQQTLEALAVFYGFTMAGDSTASASKDQVQQIQQSLDTEVLKKSDVKPTTIVTPLTPK